MSNDRINELLTQLDKELNDANDQLTLLVEEEDHGDEKEFMTKIDYWSSEVTRISNEMQSLLKSL